MIQQFPYSKYRFGVFFLLPTVNINAGFETVSGLGFSAQGTDEIDGGKVGLKRHLTGQGSYNKLTLTRGFTFDRGLYEWCRETHDTMQATPCNILISLFDNLNLPVKNWLLFDAIPTGWNSDGLDAKSNAFMTETISITYKDFMMI